jgi:LCP family protein required for cell wall assembly
MSTTPSLPRPSRAPREPRGPRHRSAFAAAFLSLLFPGLGHAYAGAWTRALGFAAAPLLLIALGAGILLRVDRGQLLGFVVDPAVLTGLLVANVLLLVYRIAAAVDAWQVARYLNAADASGGGRLGRAKLPVSLVSVVGLVVVIVVMAAGHLTVARYNMLAMDLVNCVFSADGSEADCQDTSASEPPSETLAPDETLPPDGSGSPVDSGAPDASGIAAVTASPNDEPPTPEPSATGTLAPTLPPWDGKQRLNVLLTGVDVRPGDGSFNTDTMIVVSVDPVTKQVAMFQVPRDMVDVPVPDNARSLWGSTYGGKINSWFTQNRNRTDLWPGKNPSNRGFAALKAILGKLYGLDIRYYVKVDFGGFSKTVDTLGGVLINVQMPVYESQYPANGPLMRVYIPAGPQQMTGSEALIYARSRHRATGGDFDRGRRQQRVLLSLREQMSAQAIAANLPSLVKTLGSSVKTDIPVADLPKLLALAESVDTKNIRSFVFGPSYYGTESSGTSRGYIIQPNVVRIRQAVKAAFSTKPAVLALRDRLGAESARVWIVNASGNASRASNSADYLAYVGIDASAPNKAAPATAAKTKIVVYNGAEADMPETVKYLERIYGTTATTAIDPSVTVDMIVTLGRNAPSLNVDAVG